MAALRVGGLGPGRGGARRTAPAATNSSTVLHYADLPPAWLAVALLRRTYKAASSRPEERDRVARDRTAGLISR